MLFFSHLYFPYIYLVGCRAVCLMVTPIIMRVGGRSGIILILIFMIPVVFASIHDSWFLQNFSSRFIIHEDFWLNDFVSGNVVSFLVSLVFKLLSPSRLSIIIRFVQVWNWTLSTRVTGETSGLSAPNVPPEKCLKIGLSETPYPAFPGSNAINWYVHFVELFSESRYSWFPSRSTKIHDSQVFKTKIHDSYIFYNYDSWFRFHPRISGIG